MLARYESLQSAVMQRISDQIKSFLIGDTGAMGDAESGCVAPLEFGEVYFWSLGHGLCMLATVVILHVICGCVIANEKLNVSMWLKCFSKMVPVQGHTYLSTRETLLFEDGDEMAIYYRCKAELTRSFDNIMKEEPECSLKRVEVKLRKCVIKCAQDSQHKVKFEDHCTPELCHGELCLELLRGQVERQEALVRSESVNTPTWLTRQLGLASNHDLKPGWIWTEPECKAQLGDAFRSAIKQLRAEQEDERANGEEEQEPELVTAAKQGLRANAPARFRVGTGATDDAIYVERMAELFDIARGETKADIEVDRKFKGDHIMIEQPVGNQLQLSRRNFTNSGLRLFYNVLTLKSIQASLSLPRVLPKHDLFTVLTTIELPKPLSLEPSKTSTVRFFEMHGHGGLVEADERDGAALFLPCGAYQQDSVQSLIPIDSLPRSVVIKSAVVQVFLVSFLPWTLTLLNVFFCARVNERYFLVADKSVECMTSSGAWPTLVSISVLLVMVITVAMPVLLLITLLARKQRGRIDMSQDPLACLYQANPCIFGMHLQFQIREC